MRKVLFAIIAISMIGGRSFGQITDWRAYLGEPPNPDQKTQNEHREKGLRLIEMLVAANPKSVDKDIIDILEVFKDEEEARGQASALLATVAMLRPDGSEVLKRAVPVLVSQFRDRNKTVRENSIRAVVSLQPEIPSESLEHLLALAHGGVEPSTEKTSYSDQTVTDLAVHGIARFAKTSPMAANELASFLDSSDAVEMRLAAVQSVERFGLNQPVIVARLGEILDEFGGKVLDGNGGPKQELVRRTLSAIATLGPAALSLRPNVQRITDKDLSMEVRSALSRMEK
ncbi:MAG: hypothetical protein DMG06_03195 [Acidobacteria bacterium]|nr:MAG: hypothetical protein DMG06_03195 [Acidobacteriota bacterium]